MVEPKCAFCNVPLSLDPDLKLIQRESVSFHVCAECENDGLHVCSGEV